MAKPYAELRFRASPVARLVALLLLPTAAAFIIWAIAVNGPAGILAVFPFGVIAVVAWAALHLQVAASPAGLRIDRGFTSKVVPWREVEGFWLCDQRVDGGVYVLVAPSGLELLPLAVSITPARPDRRQAAEIAEGLTTYLRATRSDAAPLDEAAVGASRLPAWKVTQEARARRAWELSHAIQIMAAGAVLLVIGLRSATDWSSWWATPLAPLGLVAVVFGVRKLRRLHGHSPRRR